MCDSLWPHGLYSLWNSPGQNTGVVAFPFSRGSSQPRDPTQVSHIAGGFFTSWATMRNPRVLEWVAYPFSSRSFQPRNWTEVSGIAGGFFTNWAIREALCESVIYIHISPPSWDCPTQPPFPTFWVITEHQAELPGLNSIFQLAICFKHGGVYMSVLLSKVSTPSPSYHFHKSILCVYISVPALWIDSSVPFS